jgi:large subunit ribosomal protein L35
MKVGAIRRLTRMRIGRMPKQKTKSAARKRFKLTAKGKVRRFRAFKSHILTKKHPKRKRRLRQGTTVSAADERRIKRLLEA